MKKRYILLKDTPELKKGAILEEECEDGNQDFQVVSDKWNTQGDQGRPQYTRDVIMQQPEWFEELTWLDIRKSQMKRVREFLTGNIEEKKGHRGRPRK